MLFIVWDEGNLSLLNDLVPSALGPLVRPGTTALARDHYSLLASIGDGFGLPRLGLGVGATPLRELFRERPGDGGAARDAMTGVLCSAPPSAA